MSFALTFFEKVVTDYQLAGGTVPLYFGQASNPARPFAVMLLVTPAVEQPTNLSSDQGEGGELRLQFSLAADSALESYKALDTLKSVVQSIRGPIGVDPDDYIVWGNDTQGVVNQDAQLGGWSAIFESIIWWDKEGLCP